MLSQTFVTAALLLTSVFAKPLSITVDISDDILSSVKHHVSPLHRSQHEQIAVVPGKDLKYVTLYMGYHQKAADLALEHVTKLRGNRPYAMGEIIADVYKQYTLYNTSLGYVPEDEFSEEDGQTVTDNFYYLALSLQGQFEQVVEQKDTIASYEHLVDYLLGLVYFMDEVYDDYNDKLYALLPTDSLKSDWTDYAAPASSAIEDAKEALSVVAAAIKPKAELK